jgi:hypothetical protein
MRGEAVFIFDSSYPSTDIALPIDSETLHTIVSIRRIEAPPGHNCLKLEEETSFASILRNLRSLRTAWANAGGRDCVVIAAPNVRPEQLLLNAMYALSLSRNAVFFDGLSLRSIFPFWRKLLKGAIPGPARRVFRGLRLHVKTGSFRRRIRSLLKYQTEEGKLFDLYTSARSFSLPPDKVTLLEDAGSLYGYGTCAWYLPAFSSRRQRYSVQTTRHRLRNVSLHVERVNGSEVSSLFKDGLILDYPYMLGSARIRHIYPVSSRRSIKTVERGINLLAFTSTYYHWLVEGVPRILDVIDDGFDFDHYPLILPPLDSFQRQILEVLGIAPDRQVITVDIGEWCHVCECVFPTANFPFGSPGLEDPSGQPDRALILRIRERLLERLALTTSVGARTPKKIYISRAKARKRKLAPEMEEELTLLLGSAGFEKVCLEDLPWPEQVRLLAGAESIVGMHGAGLANLLFTRANALLEFHNPLEARPYFAVMARELDIRYAYIIGALNGNSPDFDNITINLQKVDEWLNC